MKADDEDPLPSRLAGIVHGLDEREVQAREALVRDLLASGHSVDELLAAHADDRLALLPVTDVLRDDGNSSMAEIAARFDVRLDDLIATRRAMGLPVSTTEAIYGSNLERHAAQLRISLDGGLSVDELVTFDHVLGAAAASIAAGARDAVRSVLQELDPDGSEHTRAIRTAQLAATMKPVLAEVVDLVLEEHIRQIARREVTASLVHSETEPLVDVEVGFADLVGFTALGDTITADRLGAVAEQLQRVSRDSLAGDTELVKSLGDGVMFCSRSSGHAVDTARALCTAASSAHLPALRVGLARGPALPRAGDWYGSVVNRASRLTAIAQPGQMVVDDELYAHLQQDSGRWTDLGDVDVRGLREPVRCWVANASAAPDRDAVG